MKSERTLLFLVVLAVLTLGFTPWIGLHTIPLSAMLHPTRGGMEGTVFWKLRVPRTLLAFLAGSALACGGLAFQAYFRNSLATPFTLGVSSASAVGAVVYMRFGMSFSILGLPGICVSAFAGALLCVGLLYGLTVWSGRFSASRLLLAGVGVSLFLSSLIMLVHSTASFTDSFRLVRWLIGGLTVSGYRSVFVVAPFCVVGSAVLFLLARELDLLSTGEEIAMTRGVNTVAVRHFVLITSCLMEGSVVALCGPIAFVGLMVPHMCRLLLGSRHLTLLPGSFLLGGSFLVICDTVARSAMPPAELPAGIITSLLGGPFFLWLLLGKPNQDIDF